MFEVMRAGGPEDKGRCKLEARRLRGLVEQRALTFRVAGGGLGWRVAGKRQRYKGDRMIGWGYISEALIPVSGFPLSATLPATCHPGPPPAT